MSLCKCNTMNQTLFLGPDVSSGLLIVCTLSSLISMLVLCMAPCVYIELHDMVENTNKKVRQIKEIVRTSSGNA